MGKNEPPIGSSANIDDISGCQLGAGHEARERKHNKPLDSALQMPGAIARIGSLLQKEFFCALRIPDQEDRVGLRRENSLLNFALMDLNRPTREAF